MKDKEDSTTIDWVDEYPQRVAQAKGELDAMFNERKPTYARPNRRYTTAGMYLPSATSPELAIALNHITNVTLQDLLAEYND